MTPHPWHLETLGLPPHADAVAVRRAYAAQLRLIDQASDRAGFQRLRDAYQAALAWCEDHPQGEAPASETAAPTPTDPVALDATEQSVLTKDDAADEAMRRLREAVSHADEAAIAGLLDHALASLRHGYIDAPGQFEDLLIDALRTYAIDRRAALFDASALAFHWHEVGRLRAGDPRAAWIARVHAQAEDWLALDAGWRSTWLVLLERAQAGIDNYSVRRWPDIGRLYERIPDWLTLHLTPAKLQSWQVAFEGLPTSTREEYIQRAAPVTALSPQRKGHTPRRGRFHVPPLAWAVSWFALMLFYLIANGIFTASKQGHSEPLPHFNETPLTPRECVELYVRFDTPDAFAGMAPDEVVHAKRRAQQCALAGHWRPPGGVNRAPGR